LNAGETHSCHRRAMEHPTAEGLRQMIAAVAAGAGDGAEALRLAGVGIELQGYTVEVLVDSTDPIPAASVRVVFGRMPA